LIVEKITYSPIGVIKSPFEDVRDMPIQPTGARQVIGTVEVYPEFKGGLDSLEGFSHVILLYHFHKAASWKPMITPFLDNKPHGIFSTRAPARPNPIGLSVVKLMKLDKEQGILTVEGIDVLNKTPLLDIKPFVPAFDIPDEPIRIGWLKSVQAKARKQRADARFLGKGV